MFSIVESRAPTPAGERGSLHHEGNFDYQKREASVSVEVKAQGNEAVITCEYQAFVPLE